MVSPMILCMILKYLEMNSKCGDPSKPQSIKIAFA